MSTQKRDPTEERRLRDHLMAYKEREPTASRVLATLTGIQKKCADRWFDERATYRRTPAGWTRIMVLFHLKHTGMNVPETETLPEILQKYGELIVTQGAKNALDHATRTLEVNATRVSKIFRGVAPLSKRQEQNLRELFQKEHRDLLGTHTPASPNVAERETPHGEMDKKVITSAFVASLEATARLAEILISEHFTDEEREAVREATKHGGRVSLFRTVDLLRALLSPESLKRFNTEKN